MTVISPLGKLADRVIYFTVRNFFLLNGNKLSQDPLDWFLRSLHQVIGICLNMTDLDLFFDSLGTLPWRSLGRAAFENGLQYRHSDSKIFNGNILATFYTKMMKVDAVNPEITGVINATLWMRRQKSAYLTEYLTNY